MSKSRILLISANPETFPAPVYPLAVALLAAALEAAGHVVRQYDVLVHERERLAAILDEYEPELVGVSIRNIDNVDAVATRSYVRYYQDLLGEVRRHTCAPVVVGGSGFSLLPEQLLKALQADVGVFGPGEEFLVQLAENLPWNAAQELFPRVARALPDVREHCMSVKATHAPEMVDFYWREGGMIGLATKRGCNRHCSYCTYPVIQGRQVQWADPVEVVNQMSALTAAHGITYFFFVDSVFNVCAENEIALAEEILRQGLRCSWGAFFSPRGLTRDYLRILRRSGLRNLEFGTDSLSEPMLRSYQKDVSVEDAIYASSLCAELRLYAAHYLMLGGPGETGDTVRETMANARKVAKSVFFPFAGVRIYPGTPLYETALREGVLSPENDCLAPVFYCSSAIDVPHIWELVKSLRDPAQCWVFPDKFSEFVPAMRNLRKQGIKGPLWEYIRE